MNYTVDYIYRLPTPERVQSLLDDIDRDLEKLEQIEANQGTWCNDYRGIVERLRNTYYLAESLAAELDIDDPDGDDLEVKDFDTWANKQVKLSEGWSW